MKYFGKIKMMCWSDDGKLLIDLLGPNNELLFIYFFIVCGGRRTVSPGDTQEFIFSPNYGLGNYNNSVQCEWVIENTAAVNTSMNLTWHGGFNITGNAQNCLNDYVEVRSGKCGAFHSILFL